jgi:hypothetical protein
MGLGTSGVRIVNGDIGFGFSSEFAQTPYLEGLLDVSGVAERQ